MLENQAEEKDPYAIDFAALAQSIPDRSASEYDGEYV